MAKSISKTQRLQALDQQQARIVYFIRHGYSNKDIGEALGGLDPKTVSDYMAPIYDTLDIHIDNPNAKREEITNRYGELIDKYIHDDDVLLFWKPIPLPTDLEEKEIEPPEAEVDKTTDIGEGTFDIGTTQSDRDQSESILQELDELGSRQGIEEPPPPRRIPRWLFVVISLLVMCAACTAAVLFSMSTIRPLIVNAIAQIQATPLPTEPQAPSTTQEAQLETTTAPTNTIEQLPTNTSGASVDEQGLPTSTDTSLPPSPTPTLPTPTPIPTNTSAPTYTPTPTDTALPFTPTPKITLPFTDNFEGEDFVWETVTGNWFIANGKLTVDKDEVGMSWIALDESSLKDYRVTVDIEVPIIGTANEGDFAVGVRWLRGQARILAYAKHRLLSESGWAIFTANSVNGDPVAGYDVRVNDHFQLILEMKGNSYKAFMNGFEAQSIIYPGFEKGGIILGIRCVTDCPTFDNFKLEPLN